MIYKCRCGHSSYHQGEIENPFCPECRLNKSEIAFVECGLAFERMKKAAEASGHIIVSLEDPNPPTINLPIPKMGKGFFKQIGSCGYNAEQDICGAENVLTAGIKDPIVCKDLFVKSRLERRGTKPENFKHVLIDLIEKLKTLRTSLYRLVFGKRNGSDS